MEPQTTEYTDYEAAVAASNAQAVGNAVTMKVYQRPTDLLWCWAVTVTPYPEPDLQS